MLIRVRGGESGIREYLEEGRKDGRDYSRAELDERVILAGDLKLTDAIIGSMDKQGERYLHITLAFKEDEVSKERLQSVTDEFQQFAMTAFQADEYNFYAEAHLPKLKSYTNQRTGEFVERKPHIHIVIPEYNLLSEQNLNPFGKVDQQTKFLEAFQEHINAKYGLASPKDNRRIEFTDESAMIARYKGDYFAGANHELKHRLLTDLLDQGVTDFDRFRELVDQHGQTRIRNEGKSAEYINVKPEGAVKGVNLKEYVFSREFIELPNGEKNRRLAGELRQGYEESQSPRPTPADIAERLKEWHEVRAAEVKYLNSGSRKAYTAYREAGPEQRRALLDERAARFYAKHRAAQEIEPQPEPPAPARDQLSREPAPLPSPSQERDGRPADTVVGQRIAERNEAATRGRDDRAEFNTIKRELDAARLLASVSRSHGVLPDKYEVTKAKDGGDRIRCGGRNLNVTDFLTQELHLSWRDAAPILRNVYAEQQGRQATQDARSVPRRDLWADYRREWQPQQQERREKDWQSQKQREQDRRADLRRQYQAERRSIQNNQGMKATERKAALSLARMEKVTQDVSLRDQIKTERDELKARYRMKPADQYRAYLADRADRGDVDALAELRKQRVRQQPQSTRERIEDKDGRNPDASPIMKPAAPAAYKVDQDGNVTYFDQKSRAMFTDTGPAVAFDQTERDTLETGLRLSLAKFGPSIRLVGGDDNYRHAMVDIAADAGLHVEFSDKALQDRYEQRREAIKAGRSYIAQVDRQKPAQDKQQAKPEPERRAKTPKRDDDRSR